MESITKCLAANIRNLRIKKDFTQAELAARAGISPIFIQGIEAERKWLSPTTTKAIAKALEVPESKLFENCFEKKNAKSSKIKIDRRQAKFDHIPDDIFLALTTVCKHSKWKWEAFRWILQGYEREVLKLTR